MLHKPSKSWPRQRLYLAAAAGGLVIIGTSLWYAVYHAQQSDMAVTKQIISKAASATNAGNYDQAYKVLKASEAGTNTDAKRVVLYGELAAAAANTGKLQEAITYYTARHKLAPETAMQDAELLADAYERAGNTAMAVQQYKLAKQYVLAQPQSTARDSRVQGLDAIVANLEATQ